MPTDISSIDWVIIAAAVIAAGIARGFTGAAVANFFIAPVLAAIIGPREAVPIVLLLNALTTVQLVPGALPHVTWREMMPISIAAAIAAPVGAWVLFSVDEDIMRRVVAGAAVVFTMVLLTGWRYTGRRGAAAATVVGGTSGVFAGAVSLGGPPVFLYLMSSPDNATTNRANFIFYATVVQLAATGAFIVGGAYTDRMLWISAFVVVPFFVAVWVGTKLFGKASDETFRRVSLWGMALVSSAILLL